MTDTLTRGILLVLSFVIVWVAMKVFKINLPGWLFGITSVLLWTVLVIGYVLFLAIRR